MLSTLNKIATDYNSSKPHERCEDSIWVEETEQYIVGAVFDGCGSAKESAWASRTWAYAFRKAYLFFGAHQFLSNLAVSFAMSYVRQVASELMLKSDELLSTAILFVYNKYEGLFQVRVFGDGVLFIQLYNTIKERIDFDQNNEPDYLGYHIMDEDIKAYLDKYPIHAFHDVTEFVVCSDGIDGVKLPQFKTSTKFVNVLWSKPNSENYLTRMWNILHREGYILSDDLSIISYAKE